MCFDVIIEFLGRVEGYGGGGRSVVKKVWLLGIVSLVELCFF